MAIEIISYRKYEKNTLLGFLTVRMTSVGLEIRDMTIHEKNGKRWIGLPAKPIPPKEPGGKPGYVAVIDFYDKALSAKFQAAALMELNRWIAEHPETPEEPGKRGCDAIPF